MESHYSLHSIIKISSIRKKFFTYSAGSVFGLVLTVASLIGYGSSEFRIGVREYVGGVLVSVFLAAEVLAGLDGSVSADIVSSASFASVFFGAPGRASQTIPFLFPSRP